MVFNKSRCYYLHWNLNMNFTFSRRYYIWAHTCYVLKCSIHLWLMSRFKNEMWTTVICKLWKIRIAFNAFKHELYTINTLKSILYITENSLSRVMRFSGSWLRVIEYLVNNYSVTRSNSLEDWKDSFTPLRKPSNTHLGFYLTKHMVYFV